VISDFITNYNKYTSGGSKGEVGSISGDKVKLDEFDLKYKQTLAQYEATGQPIDENAKTQVSNVVWNQFIQERIIEKEYEKLGLVVPTDEAAVLLYTNDAHPLIKQNFSQQNSEFDPTIVRKIIDQNKKNPEIMGQIERLIKQVFLETQNRKYTSLISKSLYATSLDVEDDYYTNTSNLKGKIVSLNFITIQDKDVKVTDAEMQEYINNHKEDFKQDNLRDIDYAAWYITPTKEDTTAVRDQLANEISKFNLAENDSVFVTLNNSPFDNTYKSPGRLPAEISSMIMNAPKDSVLGPIYYQGGYSLFKVTGIKEDSLSNVHAVKCEVPIKGNTKQDTMNALAEAKKIALQVKASSNAMELLNQKSTVGEVINPYDMGWFNETTQPTDINKIIKGMNNGDAVAAKTIFGVSVIKIVAPKSKKLVQLAEVRRGIEPLQSTQDNAYNKALEFTALLNDKTDFEKVTAKAGVAKAIAKDIKESDNVIMGIPDSREIIRWIYNEDRKVGDYSEVFSLSDRLVVVRVAKIKKEGTKSLDDARADVEKLVRNEKKAAMLKAQFDKVLPNAKTMEDVAIGVKSIAQPIDAITFGSSSVPFAGSDPKLVGYLFGTKLNTISKPFVSREGVHVLFVESIVKQQLPTTLSTRKGTLYAETKGRIYENILNSLKKSEEVKDFRFRYY
jgi:peptidyl-prolyl cis-trans isomerase D